MIDAGKGFMKDGNKNRLREQDIHRIVDLFTKQLEILKFSRMVPLAEIEEKEYNLNIPRYIDSTETEDIQNIEAHLLGGKPNEDIDDLKCYWDVYPNLQKHLFENLRPGFSQLKILKEDIKQTIFSDSEFLIYSFKVNEVFAEWAIKTPPFAKPLDLRPIQRNSSPMPQTEEEVETWKKKVNEHLSKMGFNN